MDKEFLQERITKTKAIIIIYEDALTALAANPLISYRLDTGQSVQQVTRNDVAQLNNVLQSLYNTLCTMQARLNGSGARQVVPGC